MRNLSYTNSSNNSSINISLPKCKLRLLVFAVYNFLYVTYMMGYTSQTLYLGTLILFCLMNLGVIALKKGFLRRGIREFKLGIAYVITFLIISLAIQVFNSDFELYLFTGLIRITLPIVNALLLVNSVDSKDFKYFFDILLLRFIINFVWQNYEYFNLEGLLSISWADSTSEMETSLAHDFIIMEMYYLSQKAYKRGFVCVVLCMLSMKRLSFFLAPIMFILSLIISFDGKSVKKRYLNIVKMVAILSPFIILALYSEQSQQMFKELFNFDLNLFMNGRIYIHELLVNNIPYYNGYGSVNSFLEKFVYENYSTVWNAILHNDLLRIYYETTIIGVIVLVYSLVELSKKNYWHFFMICYLLFVAITSHIFNYFSVWITFYMVVMCFNDGRLKSESK